jgi:flagellar motor switch protein FliM
MNIDFNKPLLQLDGTPYKDGEQEAIMAKVLAAALATVTEGIEPLKALDWMLKLQKGEVLDLDRTDQEKLKRLITDGIKNMSMLVRGRLLEAFGSGY